MLLRLRPRHAQPIEEAPEQDLAQIEDAVQVVGVSAASAQPQEEGAIQNTLEKCIRCGTPETDENEFVVTDAGLVCMLCKIQEQGGTVPRKKSRLESEQVHVYEL